MTKARKFLLLASLIQNDFIEFMPTISGVNFRFQSIFILANIISRGLKPFYNLKKTIFVKDLFDTKKDMVLIIEVIYLF